MMKLSTILLFGCASLLLALPGVAEEKPDLETLRAERDAKVERYFMRPLTQKRLNIAFEYLEVGEHAAAREKLENLNFPRLNEYERALAYRFLAYAALGLEDTEAAIDYFEKAVEQEALPLDEEATARFTIAQLHAALGAWEKVGATLEAWFPYVEKPNGIAYYLLAISHYRREQYDEALGPALEAVELSRKPDERWLQLVAALHLIKEDFDSAVPILEQLMTRFRKKQYWVQLSLIYGARSDYEAALQVQQLAYAQGLLTKEEELLRLTRSYLFHELPYPAAQVLERAFEEGRIERNGKVLELLGNAWIAAREYEKSIVPLQQAAALAEDGRLYLRLGQVRVQREEWTQATELIQKALEKGGLEDAGKAHLLLGVSLYSNDHPRLARTAFRRAREHDSTQAEARAWLDHIDSQGQEG